MFPLRVTKFAFTVVEQAVQNKVGKTRAHCYRNILTVPGSRKALGEPSLGTAPVPSPSTRSLRSPFFPKAHLPFLLGHRTVSFSVKGRIMNALSS